ncbi:MAG: amidohydrolase family protein [Planctomycetes bacterium]|nr:amidohydrolase family protein [Planctomycetota bacterium]
MISVVLALCLQSDPPPVAIRGATVVMEPGRTLENATVVLRGGLIEAVGADAAVPGDAKVIDGKGLFVYAGFIDAHARFGLLSTRLTADEIAAREGERPDFAREPLFRMQDANRRGIRPDLAACELAVPSEGEIRKWHAAGFAVAVTAADEEYVSGTSAILSLSGAPRRESILTPRWGMHASFRAYGDGYPRTVMGALAHLRQLLLDAGDYRKKWADYRSSPQGKSRPPYDPALEALFPVLDRELPLVFEADTENEIVRALDFSAEFRLRLVLSGAGEAYKVVGRVAYLPILLDVGLPKEPKARKDDDRPKKLIEEEKRLREERVRCAIRLAASEIPFAFATHRASPADLLENVAKLVECGLSREDAIEALTSAPARILGLDRLGTIEPGKFAHLTVLTAPLGDKKAKVRYVIADGRLFEFDVAKPEIDLTGKWRVSVVSPQMEAVLHLEQRGAEVTGTIATEEGTIGVTGTVSGKSFTLKGSYEGVDFVAEGDWKDGKLSGKVRTPMGESDFTAVKPEGRHE